MMATDPSFLYIDDDSICRDILQTILETIMGYQQVTYLENSQEFLTKIQQLPKIPTIIFMGIQVEPHSGYEMLQALRSDPVYKDVKVIAITAFVMAHDVEKMKSMGFDGLISKPI
ncbi:MAG: response regulator, partial [Chloroflexota bacterium]